MVYFLVFGLYATLSVVYNGLIADMTPQHLRGNVSHEAHNYGVSKLNNRFWFGFKWSDDVAWLWDWCFVEHFSQGNI